MRPRRDHCSAGTAMQYCIEQKSAGPKYMEKQELFQLVEKKGKHVSFYRSDHLSAQKSVGRIRGTRFNENNMLERRFSVAPMMDWTDRHCRVFHRLMTRRALLYTEMLTSGAIIHGDRARLLGFDASEHPRRAAARRFRSARSRHRRGDRRGFWLRRNQSQCRLPVRPREGRPLRRLPDGRAGARRARRRRDEARGADSRDRKMPDRHRRPGSRGRARRPGASRYQRPARTR